MDVEVFALSLVVEMPFFNFEDPIFCAFWGLSSGIGRLARFLLTVEESSGEAREDCLTWEGLRVLIGF